MLGSLSPCPPVNGSATDSKIFQYGWVYSLPIFHVSTYLTVGLCVSRLDSIHLRWQVFSTLLCPSSGMWTCTTDSISPLYHTLSSKTFHVSVLDSLCAPWWNIAISIYDSTCSLLSECVPHFKLAVWPLRASTSDSLSALSWDTTLNSFLLIIQPVY
jgi:hypothetical protein